jgi:hypothetical protein
VAADSDHCKERRKSEDQHHEDHRSMVS